MHKTLSGRKSNEVMYCKQLSYSKHFLVLSVTSKLCGEVTYTD